MTPDPEAFDRWLQMAVKVVFNVRCANYQDARRTVTEYDSAEREHAAENETPANSRGPLETLGIDKPQ